MGGPVVLPAPPPGAIVGVGGGGGMAGGGAVAGGGAAAAGGVGGVCCEAGGVVTKTDWKYVGQGGAYNASTNYNYVGEGCGSYDKQVTTTLYGWKFRQCCLIGLPCLLLIPLLLLLLSLVGPGPAPDETPVVIETTAPTPAPSPNCALGQGLVSVATKIYCCHHFETYCPTTTPPPPTPRPPTPPPTTSLLFDCSADFRDCYECLVKHWSVQKLAWCCAHARRGCPTTPPPPPPAGPPVRPAAPAAPAAPGAGDLAALRLQRRLPRLLQVPRQALVRGQAQLVLRPRGPRLPDDAAAFPRHDQLPLRLQRRLRQLGGRLVPGQEGVVLPARGQGLHALRPPRRPRVCGAGG